MSESYLQWARWYASLGWKVLPLHSVKDGKCSCGKDCGKSAGKHPRIRTGTDHDAGSTDPEQLGEWWARWPEANIGVVTGAASGIVVLDIDGELGRENMAKLSNRFGTMPRTWMAETGSGGLHYVFRHPGEGRVTSKAHSLAKNVDIRGDGGLIVAAPSVHYSGNQYHWRIYDGAIAPFDWLGEALRGIEEDKRAEALRQAAPPPPPPAGMPDRSHVLRRAERYLEQMPSAISGSGGHTSTFDAACALVRGFGLSTGEAYDLLARIHNPTCKPPWSEKDLRHKIESAAKDSTRPWGYLLLAERPGPTPPLHPVPQTSSQPPASDAATTSPRQTEAERQWAEKRRQEKWANFAFLEHDKATMAWLGFRAVKHMVLEEMREIIPDEFRDAFEAGAAERLAGADKHNKPEYVNSAVREKVRRRMERLAMPLNIRRGVENPGYEIISVVRRPVFERSTFAVTIRAKGRQVVVSKLSGGELVRYRYVYERAIERGLWLPDPTKANCSIWKQLIQKASEEDEVQNVDPEESVGLAIREVIIDALSAAREAATVEELENGAVVLVFKRNDEGQLEERVCVKIPWLREHIYASLTEDTIKRTDIWDAALSLGVEGARPSLKGKRCPRLWSFSRSALNEEMNDETEAA